MDTLRAIELFVLVAETGSFREAANKANYSNSLISKEISKLEDHLGARLLQRSTRQVQLTEVGIGYLKRCKNILKYHIEAKDFIQESQNNIKGKLRVNAPMTLGITNLAEAFASFTALHPDVALDVELSDTNVDLIEHGYDIGFRASSTGVDSNYIGKPIATFPLYVVSTRDYITANGPIKAIEHLYDHNCYIYSLAMNKDVWPIGDGVRVSGNIVANNTIFIKEALLQNQGIALLPSFVCRNEIESGELIKLLPEIELPKLSFYVLYPSRQYTPPKLTKFVNFISEWFQKNEYI